LSPNASSFWSFNKTKQNAFSKNICSCQLSKQKQWNLLVETSPISLTHWRGMKKRSEIFSILGLCRCNFFAAHKMDWTRDISTFNNPG
jgi:hypothetical protein